jgi:primosomal protein N' (replication factor Y)
MAGEVVVQSFTPQAEAIQFARHADYAGFSDAELAVRRQFGYPPQRHLIRHLLRGKNPDKLKFFSEQWARRVREGLGGRLEVRGPAPAPIEKIRDEYRWQLWYFTDSITRVIGDLSALLRGFRWPDDVTQMLDVDPMNLV